MNSQKIDRDAALGCLRRAMAQLKENRKPRYHDLLNLTVGEFIKEFPQLFPTDGRRDTIVQQAERYGFAVPFVEGYSYIQTLGYIVNEFNGNAPPNQAGFRITELGARWAEDNGDPAPEDESGYFSTLKALFPNLDPIVEQYIVEAVRAYGRQTYFASAVMIGAASEKCLYLLMDALATAIQNPQERGIVQNAIAKRRLPTMFTLLRKHLSNAKDLIPWSIYEGGDCHIFSFQEAIRIQRNDAVHPDAGQVSPEQVRLMLACFPAAYKKLSSLTAWLSSNKI